MGEEEKDVRERKEQGIVQPGEPDAIQLREMLEKAMGGMNALTGAGRGRAGTEGDGLRRLLTRTTALYLLLLSVYGVVTYLAVRLALRKPLR